MFPSSILLYRLVYVEKDHFIAMVCLLLGCLTSQPHATVPKGLIRLDSCMSYHTETIAGWLVGCLKSVQHASASLGQICSDKFMCCHAEK